MSETKFDMETVAKLLEEAKERNKPKQPEDVLIKYHDDVKAYISSKYPEIPEYVVLDILSYATGRMSVSVVDAVWERDREWRKHMDGEMKRLRRTKRGVESVDEDMSDERGTEE